MSTPLPLNLKEPDRQARLNAWFALHGVKQRDVAVRLGVTPQAVSLILAGVNAPGQRIEAMVAMGIPRDLLPEPSTGRRKAATGGQAEQARAA